jgi:tetratricopeptide (TPR) repeat protein
MAAQIGNLDVVSHFGSQAAFLHNRACDFAGAAAIARNELQRESLTGGARQNALFELAFALLGLGELDEAQALFTAPELVWAPEVGAMPWSAQLRLREGLAQVWLARGDLERARDEAEALLAWGRSLRMAGQSTPAATKFAAARAIYEHIGASGPWLERLGRIETRATLFEEIVKHHGCMRHELLIINAHH